MRRFEGKRILIFQQRGWAIGIGHHLAVRLRDDGAVLGALTLKKTTDTFIRGQREVSYQFLLSHDSVMEDPEAYLAGDRYSLEEIGSDYGVDSVWPLVQSLRNYVKSYRDKYYYGYKQNIPDDGILLYLQAAHKMCKSVFADFAPDLIIAPNFVAYPHVIVNLYARCRDVRMLAVTDSKVKGINVFTESYLDDAGSFIDRINLLNEGHHVSANAARAEAYIAENRRAPSQTFSVSRPPSTKPVAAGLRFARRLAGSLRRQNRLRGIGTTQDSQSPAIVWRDFWAEREYRRAANSFPYAEFDAVAAPYAFMPLQFQPEATIDVVAPRFNNQIETARQVAMSLPGDLTLVVKDHPAMLGYRSPSYLEKVARTPNVKLIDYRIPTQTILQRAALVVGPNGTVFFEAALQGVPVVQLGDLGTTRLLPNVTHHRDLSTLGQTVREILDHPSNATDYERRLVNYVAAAYDVGFDLNYFGVWERGERGDMDAIYDRFACEIERGGAAAMPRPGPIS